MIFELGYYMVMVQDGPTPPKVCYRSPLDAKKEAERLSKKFNKKAVVLQIVAGIELKEVPVTELKIVVSLTEEMQKRLATENDLPF